MIVQLELQFLMAMLKVVISVLTYSGTSQCLLMPYLMKWLRMGSNVCSEQFFFLKKMDLHQRKSTLKSTVFIL